MSTTPADPTPVFVLVWRPHERVDKRDYDTVIGVFATLEAAKDAAQRAEDADTDALNDGLDEDEARLDHVPLQWESSAGADLIYTSLTWAQSEYDPDDGFYDILKMEVS